MDNNTDTLTVFFSYSRDDRHVADLLVDALEKEGFRTIIDRRDLPYGEKWQSELAEFITQSDTVIWLISQASISSKWCNWELDELSKQSKRLVPIRVGHVAPTDLPRQLGQVHILPADGLFDLGSHLNLLTDTLNADRDWIKEHTRLLDRATQWVSKERANALLLRGRALREAEIWQTRQPNLAPHASPMVLDLVLASKKAALARLRFWLIGIAAGFATASGLASIAYWQFTVAERQTILAEQQRELAEKQRNIAEENAVRAEAEAKRADARAKEARGRQLTAEAALLRASMSDVSTYETFTALSVEAWRLNPNGLAYENVKFALRSLPTRTFEIDRELSDLQFDALGKHVIAISDDPDGGFTLERIEIDTGVMAPVQNISPVHFHDVARGKIAYSEYPDRLVIYDVNKRSRIADFQMPRMPKNGAFSQTGDVVASQGYDGRIYILNTAKNEVLGEVEVDEDSTSIAMSRDGLTLFYNDDTQLKSHMVKPTGGNFVPNLEVIDSVISNEQERIEDIKLSNDGQSIAVRGAYFTKVIDLESGGSTLHLPLGGVFGDIAFDPRGEFIATTHGNTAIIYDIERREEFARIVQAAEIVELEFSNDGKYFVTYDEDGVLSVFEPGLLDGRLQPETRTWAEFTESGIVTSAAFSPDGSLFGATGFDGAVGIWTGTLGEEIFLEKQDGIVWVSKFGDDGQYFATGGKSGSLKLLRTSDQTVVQEWDLDGEIWSIDIGEGGLIAASAGRTAHLLKVGSETPILSVQHRGEVQSVSLNPGSTLMASASFSGSVKVNSTSSEETVFASQHDGKVWSVLFSPDGKYLATESADHTAKLIDTSTWEPIVTIVHDEMLTAVSFSRDGSLLATGGMDDRFQLVETANGQIRGSVAQDGSVKSLKFQDDGSTVAVTGRSGTRFLDVSTLEDIAEIRHRPGVDHTSWNGALQLFSIEGSDGRVVIFDTRFDESVNLLCEKRLGRNLSTDEWARYMDANVEYAQTCERWRNPRSRNSVSPGNGRK